EDLALFADHGLTAAAARWILALRAHQLVPDRGVLVAHRAGIALHDEPWPRGVRAEVLADLEIRAAARVLDRLHAVRAQGLRDVVEGRVLRGRGERREQHHDYGEPAQECAHRGASWATGLCDGNGGGMLAAAAAGVKHAKRVQFAS